MKLYQFPIRKKPGSLEKEFQLIDLDSIVSIGVVNAVSYTGGCIGESRAYFDIHCTGIFFKIEHFSNTSLTCPQIVIDTLQQDRLDLIKAWEEKSNQPRSISTIEKLQSDVYNGYDTNKIGNAVNILIEAHNSIPCLSCTNRTTYTHCYACHCVMNHKKKET